MEKLHIFNHEYKDKKTNIAVSSCGFQKLPLTEICELCLVIFNPQNDGSFSDQETLRLAKKEFGCGIADNRTLLQNISNFTYHKNQKIKELSKNNEEQKRQIEKLEKLNKRTLWQIIKDKFNPPVSETDK